VRYGKERKQETRRRIVQTAGRRFKRDGIDGSGIATLMSDAGLTNGAFYAHFASKEDLVATTVADHYAHSARASARWRPATPELSNTHGHLTVQHRDTPTAALRRPARRNRTLHRRNQARPTPTAYWSSSMTSPPA
jgi:AcrR family transcriptional regulator